MTAEEINKHLSSGGVVQITTYLKSWLYTQKHTGWFSDGKDGHIYVNHGKKKLDVSGASIRLGRYA